jgi:hypothetical protein
VGFGAPKKRLGAGAGLARLVGLHALPAVPRPQGVRHADETALNNKTTFARVDDASRQVRVPEQRAGAHSPVSCEQWSNVDAHIGP